MEQKKKPNITASFSYLPLEETLEIVPKKESMFIGIPREEDFPEKRVALTPSAVSVLVNNGHQVWVEHNAGANAFYFDNDYSEAGAKICYDKKELFSANIIIKTAPISDEEANYCQHSGRVIKQEKRKCGGMEIVFILLLPILSNSLSAFLNADRIICEYTISLQDRKLR